MQHLRELIVNPEFIARHRFEVTDFTRVRCLSFVNVVIFLINMIKGALQRELDGFFQVLRGTGVAERVVTKSAFCAARKKLKPSAFVEMNQHLIRCWYRLAAVRRWRGLDLRSVDGTTLRLPTTPEVTNIFGQMVPAQGEPVTMARASHLYDPLNGLVLDAVIAPYHHDERSLLLSHLEMLHAGSLLLLDAGYPAFWLFANFQAKKIAWCARMPLDSWTVVKDFLAAGGNDQIVMLHPSAAMRAECAKRKISAQSFPVRLIRVALSTGETEVLMTSLLDFEEYPTACFADLYFLRWGQEENYKRYKSRLEVENWSGLTPITIYQDFYAKVFSLNLTMALAHTAQEIIEVKHADDQHPKQVNVAHALCTVKNAVVRVMCHANPLPLLHSLIDTIAKTVEPIRPQRAYPRKQGPRLHGYHMAYKPCT